MTDSPSPPPTDDAPQGRAALGIDHDDAFTDADRAALEGWLGARLPGAGTVRVGDVARPSGGFSAETFIVPLTVEGESAGPGGPDRVVLRREVPDPAVYPQQAPGLDVEVDIQYRVMEALAAHSALPIAPRVGYEADPAILGAPFFVMGFVEGEVPGESPPYPEQGFFRDAAPEQRRSMVEGGLEALARLHAVDWRAAGLDFLVAPGVTPGTAHQLALWEAFGAQELHGRHHPQIAAALPWLHAHVPDDPSVGLCWGDPRPGNVIWRDFGPACVTDFEAASIGSPLQDLGWWLMFDRTMHPDGTRLDGDPTPDEQRAVYAAAAGVEVSAADVAYHEVFAALRYAVIVVRVMNRLVARGDLPADEVIWRENPAATCLADVLEELT